jgi:hypothetical protein
MRCQKLAPLTKQNEVPVLTGEKSKPRNQGGAMSEKETGRNVGQEGLEEEH